MSDSAARVIDVLDRLGYSLGTAESLTGGLVCAALVDVPGASRVVRGAIVAYDPTVKTKVLGVDAGLIARCGTVHADVARQMAQGAQKLLGSDVAVSITGVAGPGPAEGHEPGTVIVAIAVGDDEVQVQTHRFTGDRSQVRQQSVFAALSALAVTLEEQARAGNR